MDWSKSFIPTLKETPGHTEAVSHQLMLRAGLVNMLTSGVYSYLPLGLRVLSRVENIIREEMNVTGAQELFLPCLQPIELWKQTGRDKTMGEVMLQFKDKRGREVCLGPTHEEVITDLVKQYVQSYRQLPVTLYQIQTKFRDELRTRFGVVRASEFIMKDAYSFDRDVEGLKKNYEKMHQAYGTIFRRCGLQIVTIAAEAGAMGGDVSHEFLVPAAIGEDAVILCPDCGYQGKAEEGKNVCPECGKQKAEVKTAIELGHIFQLGTKYSQAQEALFLDEDGKQKPIIMGCYGIGVSRMIAAIIETSHDDKRIIWPQEVAPFDLEILPLQVNDETMGLSRIIDRELSHGGVEVLIDDREASAGVKFNDADLVGIPFQFIIGQRGLKEGKLELKARRTQKVSVVPKDEVVSRLKDLVKVQSSVPKEIGV